MIGEYKACSTCKYHRRILIRTNKKSGRIWVCDNDDSFYDGIETAYDGTCDVWERREGDDR